LVFNDYQKDLTPTKSKGNSLLKIKSGRVINKNKPHRVSTNTGGIHTLTQNTKNRWEYTQLTDILAI